MKIYIKELVAIMCIVGSSFVNSSCTESDFLPEENKYESDESLMTRANIESPYYFYDHENNKVYLKLNTENAFFSIKEAVGPIDITTDMKKYAIKATEFRSDIATQKQYNRGTVAKRMYTELNFEKKLSDEQYLTMLSEIRLQNKDAIVAPYFNDISGDKVGLSNFFYVKLNNQSDVNTLEKMAEQNNCIIISQDEFMPSWYKLSVTELAEQNALECANLFHESGLFASAEPDLMADVFLSNDTYFSQQWGLSSLNMSSTWELSTGSGIKVAVIDEGFELNHPDLVANVHSLSYDCQSGTAPQQIRGIHGTAVAGIVGAVKDNGIGIAGIAPDCKLMSISHSLIENPSVKQELARGINWAWQNGADVINCSWGHPTALTGSYITDAIYNAISNGRGGKGCVIVASSGNDKSSTVSYPALLAVVTAVGGITNNNRRADFSNYGGTLDVVAPGEGIYTTDRQGSLGYNNSNGLSGNYTSSFRGTSAAAPFVSGIAALILSRYPQFTWSQVQKVIERSCQKIGGYNYYYNNSNPNGTWNLEMGYGLVDVQKAFREANDEVQLGDLKSTPAFDFKIFNNSAYNLNGIYINLSGNVGGSYTTLFTSDPGMVSAGDTMEGFPTILGYPLSAPAGTLITNLNLDFYANNYYPHVVEVRVRIDNNQNVYSYVAFGGGNTVRIPLPNSTVPYASRRTVTVEVYLPR